jgi:Rrf2 family iron-sulfur cluster assembly transcriptional regulator
VLTLTRKCEYALMALCHMARQPAAEVVSARELSDAHGIPLPLLMNILKELHQAGLLQSFRGARGGYALSCDLSRLSLAQLIESLEGPVKFVRCADPEHACELSCRCTVRSPLINVHERLKQFLQEVSVADIAADPGGTAGGPIRVALSRNGEIEPAPPQSTQNGNSNDPTDLSR